MLLSSKTVSLDETEATYCIIALDEAAERAGYASTATRYRALAKSLRRRMSK